MESLTDDEIRILRSIAKGLTADEWRALKALAAAAVGVRSGSPQSSNGHAPSQDELSDAFLDSQPWADRVITKNPKRWAGDSMVDYRYSEAPSEWLDVQAEAMEYKAQKGREQNPPRLNNKGKPWHEADAFEAKICRAWARRNRGKALPPPRSASSVGQDEDAQSGDASDAYEEEGSFVP